MYLIYFGKTLCACSNIYGFIKWLIPLSLRLDLFILHTLSDLSHCVIQELRAETVRGQDGTQQRILGKYN